jgi:hypothetical protein
LFGTTKMQQVVLIQSANTVLTNPRKFTDYMFIQTQEKQTLGGIDNNHNNQKMELLERDMPRREGLSREVRR